MKPTHRLLTVLLPLVALAAANSAAQDAGWPDAPVAINQTEAVIEAFWAPDLAAETRWTYAALPTDEGDAPEPVVSRRWDCVQIGWTTDAFNQGTRIERVFDLPLRDYDHLLLRLNLGPDCLVTLSAKTDGQWQQLGPPHHGDLAALEIAQAISGTTLEGIRIDLSSAKPGHYTARLRWLMLQKPGTPWSPPAIDFGKFIVETPAIPQPGLELLFDPLELDRMRDLYLSPPFDKVRAGDTQLVSERMAVNPLANLRPFLLYGRESIRAREQHYRRDIDGLLLAMHGLLTRDETTLTQAAKYAIVLAHMDHWADGFMDRFPGSNWTHSGFAPNVGTLLSSLLLDWCWDVLTPAGRDLIREAIKTKGLPYVEEQRAAVANQGVRFHKGLILGKIACDTSHDPHLKTEIAADLARMNAQLTPLIRADGTFAEELGYGLSTLASTLVTYQAAARYLDRELIEVVHPRIIDGLNFALLQQQTLSAPLAAFATGPLQAERLASLCAPSSIIDASGFTSREMTVFGLDWLWAPAFPAHPHSPPLPAFSVHPQGGWVFAGSEPAAAPRLGFESGFWDEEGHNYKRKNALTLSVSGDPLLLTRHHVAYADKRHPLTTATTAYNTFAPGGRNQEPTLARASLNRGLIESIDASSARGGELTTTADLGHTVIIESDTTTAWSHNVSSCLRRVLLLRPGLILVEDTARLDSPETGVQTWNSLFPWTTEASPGATLHAPVAPLDLEIILPGDATLHLHKNSVHRQRQPRAILPVHAATVTLPAASSHRLITLLSVPGRADSPPVIEKIPGDASSPTGLRIQQGDTSWIVAFTPAALAASTGADTDGSWGIVTLAAGQPVEAAVFAARRLTWEGQSIERDEPGVLFLTRPTHR